MTTVLKLALFPNFSNQKTKEITAEIVEFLKSKGVDLYADDAIANALNINPISEVNPKNIDFLITLGGDGTLLRAVHQHPNLDVPIMAINLGSLGFMADIPFNEIYPSLQALLSGHFTVKNRIMMEAIIGNKHALAVNEVTIHRARNSNLVDLTIFVDGVYLNTFSADGVIVSTPSGSTAYSMAAGGPILTPELEAFVLTPICPHTISNRPIVLMPEKEIRIQYLHDSDSMHEYELDVSCDGQESFQLYPQEMFSIVPSKRFFKLINLPHHHYFLTLREKLGWRGQTLTQP